MGNPCNDLKLSKFYQQLSTELISAGINGIFWCQDQVAHNTCPSGWRKYSKYLNSRQLSSSLIDSRTWHEHGSPKFRNLFRSKSANRKQNGYYVSNDCKSCRCCLFLNFEHWAFNISPWQRQLTRKCKLFVDFHFCTQPNENVFLHWVKLCH